MNDDKIIKEVIQIKYQAIALQKSCEAIQKLINAPASRKRVKISEEEIAKVLAGRRKFLNNKANRKKEIV